jgi:hypothetical protein
MHARTHSRIPKAPDVLVDILAGAFVMLEGSLTYHHHPRTPEIPRRQRERTQHDEARAPPTIQQKIRRQERESLYLGDDGALGALATRDKASPLPFFAADVRAFSEAFAAFFSAASCSFSAFSKMRARSTLVLSSSRTRSAAYRSCNASNFCRSCFFGGGRCHEEGSHRIT